jgi:hypothetical protein
VIDVIYQIKGRNMTEQINDASTEAVETPTTEEVFEKILDAEESPTDQTEAEEVEQEETEEVDEEEYEEESTDEDEMEDDEELDEEESEEDEPEAERTFKVKAAGEELDVTESELIKSYQMGKDYTKKSQKLAEQAKVVEANAAKVYESMQLRDEYAQKLSAITQVLNEDMESEEDLINMKENDPVGYAVKVAEQTENQRKMKLIEQEQQKLAMQQRAAQQQQFAQNISLQSKKLTELIPEFSDAKKAEQVKRDIRAYGKDMGFSDQEMSTVYDARHVSMLHKAMKYDRLMSNKGKTKKQVTNAPRMAKNRGKVKSSDVYTKQKRRLKSSGKVEDAVSVFKNFL